MSIYREHLLNDWKFTVESRGDIFRVHVERMEVPLRDEYQIPHNFTDKNFAIGAARSHCLELDLFCKGEEARAISRVTFEEVLVVGRREGGRLTNTYVIGAKQHKNLQQMADEKSQSGIWFETMRLYVNGEQDKNFGVALTSDTIETLVTAYNAVDMPCTISLTRDSQVAMLESMGYLTVVDTKPHYLVCKVTPLGKSRINREGWLEYKYGK